MEISRYDSELSRVYLRIGEIHISKEPTVITTVLGSCISVTMFSSRSAIGGMCHGFLPQCQDFGKCDKEFSECLKFVDCSIWRMVDRFRRYGIMPRDIETRMFGGASFSEKKNDTGRYLSVGDKNIESARQVVVDMGLNLVAADVGGASGRRVVFYTHTGDVFLD